MKYLSKILGANEIDDSVRERATALYLEAKERLGQIPVPFSEDAQLMLSNHLMALIKRALEGKFVDPIDEEMMGELSKKAWEYADILAGPIFEAAGLEKDRTEVFLVGTHMEMAMASAMAG